MLKSLVILVAVAALEITAPASATQRIAGGGVVAAPAWTAAILSTGGGAADERLVCGGALVAPRLVITAAHCVYGFRSAERRVVLGQSVLDGSAPEHAVSAVSVHPGYDPAFLRNDVALLTLAAPVAELPVAAAGARPGVSAVVRGWGATATDGAPSAQLRAATLSVLPARRCERRYGDYHNRASMLCAAGQGVDPCAGDSGSPLTVAGPDGSERLVAVVSSGDGCGAGAGPTNLTRLTAPAVAAWLKRLTGASNRRG